MINTKLILVDGISGSGKSTTAHYIFRQIEKNGIKVKWIYEQEKDHPLQISGKRYEKKKDEHEHVYSRRFMNGYYANWKKFIKKVENDDSVYIIESFLFQDVLFFPHFMNDLDRDEIKKYSHKLINAAKHLDPVIVHLYQKDAKSSMRRNWQRRGDDWKGWVVKMNVESLYCKNRELKGDEGSLQIWQDFTDFTVELYHEYKFNKIQIDNLKQDWDIYRDQILKFLKLKKVEEKLYSDQFKNFYGEYIGFGQIFKLHEKDNRLCVDVFWKNLKLLPVSKNELEMEGFPISFKFYNYGGKKKLKLIKSDCYYKTDSTAEEYKPYKISKKRLEGYSAVYWCEADKLERKLYVKDDKFYYWREKGNESLLIPMSDTKFMMNVMVGNLLEFTKVKGEWQFTFDVYEKKPTHSLFVKKNG